MSYAGPPPQSPYGAPQPFGPPGFSATNAIGYGWRKFTEHLGTMLLIAVLILGLSVAISTGFSLLSTILGLPVSSNPFDQPRALDSALLSAQMVLSVVESILITVVSVFLQAAAYKGALLIVDGRTPSLGDLFQGWDKGKLIATMIVVWLVIFAGTILCIIPGIIAAFLLTLAPIFAVDNLGGSITDPLKRSYELVKNNIGQMLLLWLLTFLITIAGLCLCGVGLLVALPVVWLGQAYTARVLEGRPVAP